MIRLVCLCAILALAGCGPAATAGLMLVLTAADKAAGITDGVVTLIKPAAPVACPVASPSPTGEALNGERQ